MYKMVLETMSSIKQTEAGKRKGDRKKKKQNPNMRTLGSR
jgi:hypothetical protein